MILDGAMIRAGSRPSWSASGGCSISICGSARATDMHSGMFGAAALNARHALMTALSSVVPRADGRLPDELRAGATPPTAEELDAWAQLPSGGTARALRRGAIAPGPPTSSTCGRSRTRRST